MNSSVRFAFDLDATITQEEILVSLARNLLPPEQQSAFTQDTQMSVAGRHAYGPSLRQRVQALAGLDTAKIQELIAQIPLQMPIVSWIRAHAQQCMLVTHNFAEWIVPITEQLGCQVHASTPELHQGRIVGLKAPLDKAKVIQAQVAQGHVVIAVGDGANDVPMLAASHWGIAWSGLKPAPDSLLEVAQEEQQDPVQLCGRLDELIHRSQHAFLSPALDGVYQAIAARRDIRAFLPGSSVDSTVKHRLLQAFFQAPNVGLMQPAVVIDIQDPKLRRALHAIVDKERQETAEAYARQDGTSKAADFLSLKVEGILDCAELWVVALRDQREQEIFGRRTMPQMDLASAACAIQNLWLAARAEGLGLGWVSIFDPRAVAQQLNLPEGAEAIAILCIGPAREFPPLPKLQRDGWREPKQMQAMLFQDRWGQSPAKAPRFSTKSAARSHRELVLGGARSGKSQYAEALAIGSSKKLVYIATAEVLDQEMAHRVQLHQERRGPQWQTHAVTTALAQALQTHCQPDTFVLVDCLTLWISNCLHHGCWPTERTLFLSTLTQLPGMLAMVSNEVGQGVVPLGKLSRDFVDESGRLHQALATRCSHVTMVVAGLPQPLKTP